MTTTRRKVNLNSYHRNRNGYCADRNCWSKILCCSYSVFAIVLARKVSPLDRNHYSAKPERDLEESLLRWQ